VDLENVPGCGVRHTAYLDSSVTQRRPRVCAREGEYGRTLETKRPSTEAPLEPRRSARVPYKDVGDRKGKPIKRT
jgi:hypothetical protein